jgi:hypothetical protein
MRLAGHVARMERREMHTMFWLENLKVRDNIKIDFRKTEWKDVDWIQVTQDSDQWRIFVNMIMNLRVP